MRLICTSTSVEGRKGLSVHRYLRLSPDEMSNQFRPSLAHQSADIRLSNFSTFGPLTVGALLLIVEVCSN